MAVLAKAAVAYKKKPGEVKLLDHNLEWTEQGSAQPGLSIAVSAVQNLQASPATAAASQMRIFAAATMGSEPVAHTFKFLDPKEARTQMDTFVTALQKSVAAKKAASTAPAAQSEPAAAADKAVEAAERQSIAQILSSTDVENDVELQQSLLKVDKELGATFRDAVMNGNVTNAQFWSSRVHLLRAHMVERSQQRGPYNVLATIRPKTVDNRIRVNMTREKIKDVFNQHPILKRIYDENVPPLTEEEFWSRFFVSRLCKKLRGERVLQNDPVDAVLDAYLDADDFASRKRARESEDAGAEAVPYVIDIEGNEEHNSKRMGNAPDYTMRPQRTDVVNSINSISLRMLDALTPAEQVAAGVRNNRFEQEFYEQGMQLADLRQEESDDRLVLQLRDQQAFLRHTASNAATSTGAGAAGEAEIDRRKALQALRDAIPPAGTPLDLRASIGSIAMPELDGARRALDKLMQAASKRADLRADKGDLSAATAASTVGAAASGVSVGEGKQAEKEPDLSPAIAAQVAMCHAAAQEFLSIFWRLLLAPETTTAATGSGGDGRAGGGGIGGKHAKQLAKMIGTAGSTAGATAGPTDAGSGPAAGKDRGTLRKTYDRVDAICRSITTPLQSADPSGAGGGRSHKSDAVGSVDWQRAKVRARMRPTLKAVDAAIAVYERAVARR